MEGCGVRWLEQRSLDERRLVAAASSAHGDLCAVLIDADARLRVFGRRGAVALEHCHAVSFGDRAGLVLCADGGLFYVDVGNFDDELPWLRRVEGLPPAACVRAVAGGGARLLAVAEDGALYAVTLIGAKCVAQPVPRPPGTARVVAVAVGGDHALFVTEAGALYAFGAGGNGRLGLGDERPATVAQRVGVPLKCAWVAAGAAHSFVVCAGGECFGFGANARGQLGVGDADDRAMPTRLRLVPPKSIGAGSEHTVVASHDGKASAFGRADVVGAARDELRPRRIQALQGIKIVLVDAGRDYSHAVAADGAVYCWGRARGGGFSPARSPAPLAARTTAECAVCAREMHRAAMDARLPPLPRAAARMQPRDAEPPFPCGTRRMRNLTHARNHAASSRGRTWTPSSTPTTSTPRTQSLSPWSRRRRRSSASRSTSRFTTAPPKARPLRSRGSTT
ncbi:regulator of chromosome condensation 1/beta-lactamase-inhibitor protein II [Pelagophyceae sp. CCMP2097]|nr:regulator of chromosome condensation 1/beta-lactamase-inhibitor protein II [Pelagophyceae sp. CCMP2097]